MVALFLAPLLESDPLGQQTPIFGNADADGAPRLRGALGASLTAIAASGIAAGPMHNHIKMLLFTTAILAFAERPAAATVFTHLTAEGGAVDYDVTTNQNNGWYAEPAGNYRFKLGFKQGERASTNPVLVATLKTTDTEHFRGKAALELQLVARVEKKSLRAAYKVDLSCVLPGDPFAPPVATPKDWYHSFALKIDAAHYRLPAGSGQDVIFEQWWQGSPFHAPVVLAILNESDTRSRGWPEANTNGNFALVLRDDEHNAWQAGPGQPRSYNLGPVKPGAWIHWVVCVRPAPSGKDGAVTVWMDGAEKLKLTNTAVGYDRARYPTKPTPGKTLAVGCCIYRLNGPNTQRFFFDEIKFADSFADTVTP